MGRLRARAPGVDPLPSLRLETAHRACLRPRVPLLGGARLRRCVDRYPAPGPGQERALRPLPRLDAVRQLRRAARQRPRGAGTRGARRPVRAARGSEAARAAQPDRAAPRVVGLASQDHRAARPDPRRPRHRVEAIRQQAAQPGAASPEGRRHRPFRRQPACAVLHRVRASHARPRHPDAIPPAVRGHRRGLRRGRLARLRVPGRPAGGRGVRLPMGERIRNDLGLGAHRLQPRRAEHAAVLVVHGARRAGRPDRLQLRPLHAGQRHPQVQATVGLARRAAVVVSAGGPRRVGGDAHTRGCALCLGPPPVEAVARRARHGARAPDRPLHPIVMLRCQPPVHSPLPPRALGAGLRALLGGGASAEAAVVEQLRRQYGPRQVLRTDSGTSALTLALRHLARTAPGRSVALPAYCCYDVATAADGARIPVALYDLDPATLGPDLDSLRRALAAGAAGVVIAHLYGIPVEVDQVLALARDHGALVIDDAAQGAGAAYEGAPVGTFGAFGILSFGRGKGVTGSGGGALLANDATSARALPDLAASLTPGGGGRGAGPLVAAAAQWLLARPTLYGVPAALPFLRLGETIYRPPVPPAPPAAVQSAILAATWPLAAAEDEVRRRHAQLELERAGQARCNQR